MSSTTIRVSLLALFVCVFSAVAPAHADPPLRPIEAEWAVDEMLEQAPRSSSQALKHRGGAAARRALERILIRGTISRELLTRVVRNGRAGQYLGDTMLAIEKLQDVPGIERTLERLATVNNGAGARGTSFELQAAAELVNELAELSANVAGHETDAVLTDGTAVEMKFLPEDADDGLAAVEKGADQLVKRSRGGRALLIVNRPLAPAEHRALDRALGQRVRVAVNERLMKTIGERRRRWLEANSQRPHRSRSDSSRGKRKVTKAKKSLQKARNAKRKR